MSVPFFMPRGGPVIILKRINNNAVTCVDAAGHQVVALGRGLARAQVGTELDLDLVEHTFYDIDARYVALMRDLDVSFLELAAQIANTARALLPYTLSPNIEVALADHIQFASQRMREGIYVTAPLAFDLQQTYPLEYKIAEYALRLSQSYLEVKLPHNEAAGIAMCLVNGAYSSAGAVPTDAAEKRDHLLEEITSIVEDAMDARIDRDGFGFARFATHVQYLLNRVATGDAIESENSDLYRIVAADHERVASCVNAIAALIESAYHQRLTEEEKLYLMLHINRICTHADETAPQPTFPSAKAGADERQAPRA